MEVVRTKKKTKKKTKQRKDTQKDLPEEIVEENLDDKDQTLDNDNLKLNDILSTQVPDTPPLTVGTPTNDTDTLIDDVPSVPPITVKPTSDTPTKVLNTDTPIDDITGDTPTEALTTDTPTDVASTCDTPTNATTINTDTPTNELTTTDVATPIINNETEPKESVEEFSSPLPSESLKEVSSATDLMHFDEVSTTTDVEPPIPAMVTEVIPISPIIESKIKYPRLDSLMEATVHDEINDDHTAFTEGDLALLYVNPQLVANQEFVDNFIKESEQSHHPLYELLNQYLKARLSLRVIEAKLDDLKKEYDISVANVWEIEEKTITSNARCRDGTKVNHTHSHKFAHLNSQELEKTTYKLKELKDCLEDEVSLKSYSTQLANIHVEYYLHQLLQSVPGLSSLQPNSPITGFIPDAPPGELDHYTSQIRNCVSVLCMFERRPVRDKVFAMECKQWLDLMINALLRVASLSDHLFIINHLLRCPPGVGSWGTKYLQVLSPVTYTSTARPSSGNDNSYDMLEHSLNWTSSMLGGDSQWGGPVLDYWITMLCTLLMPISGRDQFLCMLRKSDLEGNVSVEQSQRWTLVEDEEEEADVDASDSLQLLESDYIAFLDQFPFNELFKHILQVSEDGRYTASGTKSHQMLQLIAFCTCLIRILGTVFSSLRHSRYKEFIKQVGRTVRQVVHYVADHWLNYKSCKERLGDTPTSIPIGEESANVQYRYSLNKLQTEFDQFVLRATQWLLTAHKLGAWQFMADMPYGSVSLLTLWKILWTLYHYQFSSGDQAGFVSNDIFGRGGVTERRGSVLSGRVDLDNIPVSAEDVVISIRDSSCRTKFIDVLMKTYTSESIFLLTTFVNMARSRTADSEEEMMFINIITEEIFQFTHVEDFARDTYNRTGCNLLSTIASIHPFIISTILNQVQSVISNVGENCNLLFKELPLHLWIPSKKDMSIVFDWLISKPLSSHENITAKIIISGLNWGIREDEGSSQGSPLSLILPLSLHREVALYLVEAGYRHLSTLPGGSEYNSSSSSIRKYASSIRSLMSTDQSDFSLWLWEIVLMLKLHPTQLSLMSILPQSPAQTRSNLSPRHGAKDLSVYRQNNTGWDNNIDNTLPDLSNTSIPRFTILRESVENEGILAYYVAMCLSNMGSVSSVFINDSIPMLYKLIEQGYYLPVLRVLGNVIPLMFGHRKALVHNEKFVSLLLSVANADVNNASYKDILTWNTPSPLIVRRMSAMITTHIKHYGNSLADKQLAILFWLESIFEISNWIKETSVLYLLNGICIAVYGNMPLEQLLLEQLLDQYTVLQPLQSKNKRLITSVASSVISMVSQDGGGPCLSSNISLTEYPWLSYFVLRAEQQFEEREGIWKTLLSHLKKDAKISIDNALKKTLNDLHHTGAPFISNQLSIYKWGKFAVSVDHSFLLTPLVWQRFFALYLQRPILDSNSPERNSMGLRLLSSNQHQALRREMRVCLSNTSKDLQQQLDNLNKQDTQENNKDDMKLRQYLPVSLGFYQTLKLWIQEPRLHEAELHLGGLPQQYDERRLRQVFKPEQESWVEFVKTWEIVEQVKVMVYEWGQVASYQNPLPHQTESHNANPDTAASRIEKRLTRSTPTVPPFPFQLPPAPFPLFNVESLLSKDVLLPSVIKDTEYIVQQAKIFTDRLNTLIALDAEYISGIPDLYSNIDRQFHVNVPCRSKFNRNHQCIGPAPIVFRFKEMTPHSHWQERLTDNRKVHTEIVRALSFGVPIEMCRAVARVEHAVGELLNLTIAKNDEALSCGVALFYEILKMISSDIEKFPPSSQFFTSSIEVLGQEFIQNDPSQTPTILQLIINHRAVAKLLCPIFIPNSYPVQFLSMYSGVGDMLAKGSLEVAFSVLSKFNVGQWLTDSKPSIVECRTLLESIFNGIKLCTTSNKLQEERSLLEVYLSHLKKIADYQFPLLYNDVLYHLVSGTDMSTIVPECWDVTFGVVSPPSTFSEGEVCRLGLQQVFESAKYISDHFTRKRTLVQDDYLYNLMAQPFVASISHFFSMLVEASIVKTVESIDLNNMSPNEGLAHCWHLLLDVYTPWVFPMHSTDESDSSHLFPCKLEDTVVMSDVLQLFTQKLTKMQDAFKAHGECPLSLFWLYYCKYLSLPDIPEYVLQCYHGNFTKLPWQHYCPDLESMDLMLQLKFDSSHPNASFVFLGDILPLIEWKILVKRYSSNPSQDVPVKFHIMLLQLLVMLSAEVEVMEKKDAQLPYLLSEAKSYNFHYIDAKTFSDVLEWLDQHSNPRAVLQPGSPLSSSLRFLQAVASFPNSESNDIDNILRLHQNGWEKRFQFVRFVVNLVAKASQQKDSHSLSYAEIVLFLLQSVLDVSMYEITSRYSSEMISLLQEILHLFNICDPSTSFQHSLVEHFSSCLTQLSNAHFIHLPTITATCRTVLSVPLMGHIIENTLLAYFKCQPVPVPVAGQTVQLPFNDNGYGWKNVQVAVMIPETAQKEFTEHCIIECACLSLNARLMQRFPMCTSLEQEFDIASDLVQWCTKLKPKANQEPGVFLVWEKTYNLLLRQIKYGGDISKVVPQVTTMATTLLRYGEDKATEGLLGAIGLGKKSSFSIQFRLISRIIATFVHCQMPMDHNHTTVLRLSPDAFGHIKTPTRQYNAIPILPSKQADQAVASLEGLLNNKNYLLYKEHVIYSLEFINNARFCLFDVNFLLTYLISNLYGNERCLDILRVVRSDL